MTPYTTKELTFSGITVKSVQVETKDEQLNVMRTHWQQSNVNLSKGIDFMRDGDVFVR